MKKPEKELRTATDLVIDAGKIVMKWYGSAAWETKEGNEPVTEADRETNDFLVKHLSRAFPDDGILAEESGASNDWQNKERRWCIDPIDGTREFIAGNGEFAIMVGLSDNGNAILGVVFLPARNLLYYGGPLLGAFSRKLPDQKEKPLLVSDISDIPRMRLAVSRSHRAPSIDLAAKRLGIRHEIQSGSVGIKLGMVASREADLYLHTSSGTRLWDACAPDALIQGAGGILTDCMGNPIKYDSMDYMNRGGLVASNGKSHQMIIEKIAPIVEV